jgi:hypothetical protein
MRDLDPHAHDQLDDDADLRPAIDVRELLHLHPRLLLAAGIVAIVMFPVGLFLAALAIGVLKVSGGAATDTSVVVAIAGYVVADFWGGGAVAALTRARAPQVAAAWALARLVILVLVVLVAPKLLPVAPIQLLLAIPAAYAGARVARKQAALRRQIRAEQRTRATPVEPTTPTTPTADVRS